MVAVRCTLNYVLIGKWHPTAKEHVGDHIFWKEHFGDHMFCTRNWIEFYLDRTIVRLFH
jgi:hypothetical protein